MSERHYFAGGNTALGFYSRFEDVLPPDRRKRMFYLKGGPGVGKSSLMKKVGQAAQKAGLTVEYFHCSSDPDSLDAVALPERGAAIMDGTAPHVYDPVIPGARDTLLPLGDLLDEASLRPALKELETLQGEISRYFSRCYRYLAAAKEIRSAAAQSAESDEKACSLAEKWGEALPRRGGRGGLRRLFCAAYTPKGLVSQLNALPIRKRFTVECPPGCAPDRLMARLSEAAAQRGLDRVELLDPLEPRRTAYVYLPDHGLLYGGASQGAEKADLPAESLFDLAPAEEWSFDRNAFELMTQRAVEQLLKAKALHDELEKPYVRAMDFDGWEKRLQEVLQALDLAESDPE